MTTDKQMRVCDSMTLLSLRRVESNLLPRVLSHSLLGAGRREPWERVWVERFEQGLRMGFWFRERFFKMVVFLHMLQLQNFKKVYRGY